ncbi:23S rRNA (adenine(2503)-C(2))-methyltransferase RlmN [Stygiobacter electus]|uniref:Probable dual-specificity RNA methyltransferase RlmN n=1 Tax=Stygiobacter electus TaxID=3032292 RepID=A0AAE3P1Q4_9BACT|nr:23S rRNA (adenine(2503)-C(2))-methyltransferase RlmN [Stygiobacter electus]MDF1612777.1 23S rRNA (adenine(2503)-C(2))-methyltransferase RlmN [Stygiobacter electus]
MEKIKKETLKGLTLEELENLFVSNGYEKFRASQVFNWMYNHVVFDFDEMKNLSKETRKSLSESYKLQTLDLVDIQSSPSTNTKKYLFETYDGRKIESVLIPEKERNTLCISTQVGCPLDCKFCATGLMGYKRNLTAGEIVDQYLLTAKDVGKNKITNIVFMGMGEPLLNFENTLKSIEIFTHELTKGLSRTRITVSTAGIANKIKELTDKNYRIKLALSLHSPFEEVRSKIMPINKKYSLSENLMALKEYAVKSRTRITFEYTMLKGINDRLEDAKELARICSKLPSKINIIPFNSIKHMNPSGISAELEPTPMIEIHRFADRLRSYNITVMIRETQGDDIAAACGQLAVKYN